MASSATERLREAIQQFKSENEGSAEFGSVLRELEDVSKSLAAAGGGEEDSPGRRAAREADEESGAKPDSPGAAFDKPPRPSGKGSFEDNPLFQKAKKRFGGD